MAKKKQENQLAFLSLDKKLAAIGVMVSLKSLSKKEIERVDIEDTIVDAIAALNHSDFLSRHFSLILSWIEQHGSVVIIEKLIKLLRARMKLGEKFPYASLIAQFAMSKGHKRWSTVATAFKLPKNAEAILVGESDVSTSFLKLRGEEDWSKGTGFLLPKGFATTHSKWVLSRKALAKQNHQYRNRLIYGAQWRADIITAYENGARTPTEASRKSGASYEPCYRVKMELEDAGILKAS